MLGGKRRILTEVQLSRFCHRGLCEECVYIPCDCDCHLQEEIDGGTEKDVSGVEASR